MPVFVLCSVDSSGETNASGLCATVVCFDPHGLHFLTANTYSQLTPVLHSALLTPMTWELSLVCFNQVIKLGVHSTDGPGFTSLTRLV